MNPSDSQPPENQEPGLDDLIRQLIAAEDAVQASLGGEIDSVLLPSGRRYILHKARQALWQTEAQYARLAAIVEASEDGIYSETLDGTVLTWNAAAEAIYGYSASEMIDHNLAILVPPEEREEYLRVMERARRGERMNHFEAIRQRKDKKKIWVSLSIFPLKNDAGQMVGISKIARDITDRKERDEALSLREKALNQVSQGVFITDETRRGIYANEGFERLTGYSAAEMMGRDCKILQGPGSDPAMVARLHQAMNSAQAFEGEILNYRKDGTPFWNDLAITPVNDERGEIKRFIGIQRDVTARIESDAAIRASESRFRSLFENMLEGYCYCQLLYEDGRARDYIYLEVNDAFEAHTGLKDVIGKKVSEVVPGMHEANPEQLEIYSRVAATGRPERFETHAKQIGIWFSVSVYSHEKEYFIAVFENITERKRAEARFNCLVNSNAHGVLFWNKKGEIVGGNDAFLNLVGYSREDLEAHRINWIAMTPPEYVHLDHTALEEISACGSSTPYEKEWIRKDGSRVPILIGAATFEDNPEEGVCFVIGIAERKQAERRLRLSESLLRIAGNAVRLGGWAVELPSYQTSWTDEVCAIHELPPGHKVTAEEGIAFYTPEWRDVIQAAFQACASEGTPYDLELEILTAKGHRRWVRTIGHAERDENGVIRRVSGAFQDISEKKQAEVSARLTSERLQLAAEAGGIGIWDFDCLSGFVTWDDQMFTLYGQSREGNDTVSERWSNSLHAEDRTRAEAELAAALRDDSKPFNTEFRIIRKNDGATRFIRAIARLLRDASGRPWRMVGTNWDITDERQREQNLTEALARQKELTDAAEAGERAKSEFLAVMSHEIRTPMNGILGYSELLMRTPNLPPESKDYAEIITSSSQALLRILNDILDFSRLEAGRVQIEKARFAPRDILEDIRTLFARRVGDKGLELRTSIDGDIPENLVGDAGRLRQILLNLTGNAIKFTETGSVTLGLRPGSAGESEFFVKDTGPGITPEQAERIFQPFTQADSTISRRHGGTGLGLTISRNLAELMGGTLKVRSQPGHGAEFIVTVPLREAGPSPDGEGGIPTQTLDEGFAHQHPLRILVVEDDLVNRKLILTLLRRLGYEALAVKNGLEAVELHQREHLDCILMDLQMPEMDGIEATEKIRSLEKSSPSDKPTFIIALTADIFPEDRQRCFDAGMNRYLNKPVQIARLADTLVEAGNFASKHC